MQGNCLSLDPSNVKKAGFGTLLQINRILSNTLSPISPPTWNNIELWQPAHIRRSHKSADLHDEMQYSKKGQW